MLFRNETDIKSKLKHLSFCSNIVNTSKKMYSSIYSIRLTKVKNQVNVKVQGHS